MAQRLAGKVALITGASRGLGRYCATGYAAEGATIVVAARSGVDEVAEEIAASGAKAFPIRCDVADPNSVAAMAEAVLERFGRIDILMTNAVYYCADSFLAISAEDWQTSLRVNVDGVFHCIRAFAPAMMAQQSGSIIAISSVAAGRGSPYGATKRTVLGLAQGFAQELAPHNIGVSALRPVAAIDTPGWRQSRPAEVLKTRAHRLSPADSYVEAAILLTLQSPAKVSGREFTDAQALRAFASTEVYERFAATNSPVWSQDESRD